MLALFSLAFAHPCEETTLETLAAAPTPAVILLGERHGQTEDMKRAYALVRERLNAGPVTLALEAVHEKNQPVLDAFAAGEVKKGKLPTALNWSDTWGFAWKPYKKLVTSHTKGVTVVAAGLDLGPKPEDREVTIPEGYDAYLKRMMEGHAHAMSDEVKARFTTSMAWRDFRIGELGVEGWDGQGTLVILTGRGHLEGGMGTNWQVAQMTDAPVVGAILNHEGAKCLPGDKVWSD